MTSEGVGDIQFVSRYSVFGPPNGCKEQCEGTGYIPIHARETDPLLAWLWLMCEFRKHSFDPWHFVPCPACNEKGIHSLISDVCFGWWNKVRP